MLVALMCLPLSMRGQDTVTISSASDWVSLCENYSGKEVNVRLGCDLILSDASKSMDDFRGTFDGQGHTLTVNYAKSSSVKAPFMKAQGTIRNLRIAGSVNLEGKEQSPLVYQVEQNATLAIESCSNEVDIQTGMGADGKNCSGGYICRLEGTATFEGCSYIGKIAFYSIKKSSIDEQEGTGYCSSKCGSNTSCLAKCMAEKAQYYLNDSGGYVGYVGSSSNISFANCYSSPLYTRDRKAKYKEYFTSENGWFVGCLESGSTSIGMTNCYYYPRKTSNVPSFSSSDFDIVAHSAEKVTEGQLTSGELALKLKGSTTGAACAWGQLLGTDTLPQVRAVSPKSLEVFHVSKGARGLSLNRWYSFFWPFDATIPDGTAAYVVTGINEEDQKVYVSPYIGSATAHVPLLLKHTSTSVESMYLPDGYYNRQPQETLLRGAYETMEASDDCRTLESDGTFVKPTSNIAATYCYLAGATAHKYTIDTEGGDAGTILLISSKDDWTNLTTNYSGKKVTAYLNADLTLTESDAPMTSFKGTLDGQGHTISFSMASTATNLPELFNTAQGTIKNLRLSGTVTSSGGPTSASSQYNLLEGVVPHFVGSVTGAANNDPASLTFDNCHNDATFTYTGTAAVKYDDECGFVRYVKYGTITFTDCSYQGAADCNGLFSMSGFIDYTESSTISFINSLSNFSRATNMQNGSARPFVGDNLLGFASSVTYANTYYVGSSTTTLEEYEVNGATKATADELTSGALTYALNNGRTGDNAVWMQTVGTDETPQPRTFSPDSKEVFRLDGSTRAGSSSHWTTLYYPADVTLPEGVEQYTIHSVEDSIVNAACLLDSTVKAYTPVLLYASGGMPELTLPTAYYNEFPTQQSGLLMGVTEETTTNEHVRTLSEADGVATFSTTTAGLPAWQCYLNRSDYDTYVVDNLRVIITSKSDWNTVREQYDGTAVKLYLATDLSFNEDDTPYSYFKGTLDGQGHTITVNYDAKKSENTRKGLYPIKQASGVFRNLNIDGTIYYCNQTSSTNSQYPWIYEVAGTADAPVELDFENCHVGITYALSPSEKTTFSQIYDFNGFIRMITEYATVNFKDCSSTIAFKMRNDTYASPTLGSAAGYVGSVGEESDGVQLNFTNCLSDLSGSEINETDGFYYFCNGDLADDRTTETQLPNVTFANCYAQVLDGVTADPTDDATHLSGGELATGEIAYALKAGRTGDDAKWAQTIGTDKVPQLALFSEDSKEVFLATDTVKIGSAGWSTHYYPVAKELPDGVKAYTLSGVVKASESSANSDYIVQLAEVTDSIPAYTPVLLCTLADGATEAGKTITIEMPDHYYNELGAMRNTSLDGSQQYWLIGATRSYKSFNGCYVLQQQTDAKGQKRTAFYRVNENVATPTVPAWKCVLVDFDVTGGEGASNAKAIHLRLDDETTVIGAVQAIGGILTEGQTYDLQGRKVQSLQKGQVYIKNGQKFIVR